VKGFEASATCSVDICYISGDTSVAQALDLFIWAFVDDKLQLGKSSEKSVLVKVEPGSTCGYESIQVDQAVFEKVYDFDATNTQPVIVSPKSLATWSSSTKTCPVVQLVILNEESKLPTTLFGELDQERLTTGAYIDGQGSVDIEFPLYVNKPGCVSFAAYAATSNTYGGYTKGKFCVCGNEKVTAQEGVYVIELNQTKEGLAPRNTLVDSTGMYTE